MNKKIIIFFITAVMILSSALYSFADQEISMFSDIENHWAKDNIIWNVLNGFFSGKSDKEFDPDGVMTRGMFVTVLMRIAEEDPEAYNDWYLGVLFSDVSAKAYYAPFINWAVRNGVASGTGERKFSPDMPVTREQMAALIYKLIVIYNCEIVSNDGTAQSEFSDMPQVSAYAVNAVKMMKDSGMITGKPDGKGGLMFDPTSGLTRAECATVLRQFVNKTRKLLTGSIPSESIAISAGSLDFVEGDSAVFTASISPSTATNKTIVWVSKDPSVAKVDLNGKVTAVSGGSTEIYAFTSNGKNATVKINVEYKEIPYKYESYEDKCMLIFGKVVKDPRNYYKSKDAALADMTEITVRTWDFTDSSHTAKTTRYFTLTVNKHLAGTYKAIFEEIYNGKEKFPIKSLGCFRWSSGSEHNAGMAVDINPFANYMIDHGKILSGDHWSPDTDPYSIPLHGDVVNAFAKYGFSRGFWGERKDYMHFSYFGT